MKPIAIDGDNATALERIPESCGAVTVGCSEIAGVVEEVIRSSEKLRAEHEALADTVSALEEDQTKVADASDEARLLSERAITRLGEGTVQIQSSLSQINTLLDLVDTLGQHVTSFSAAMEQVRRSAKDIEDIAETTNILALNATIEAMRAGEAGKTFAVVANEVKGLAYNTRTATEEIAETIDALGVEASTVIGQIEQGSGASEQAKASVAQIESTISSVGELVEEVDHQNDVIARSTNTISQHVGAVQSVLKSFDEAAIVSEGQLLSAQNSMVGLEQTANAMFDTIVHAGLSPQDNVFADISTAFRSQLEKQTEAALEAGEVSISQLFDTNYVPVPDSDPVRYKTSLTDWADRVWRPFFDEAFNSHPQIISVICSDMNGFLPTHLSQYSREPVGELAHDTAYCRNGRINFTELDVRAKDSTAPYMLAVYRHEGDGETSQLVRNIFVPIFFGGKRWGDFEIAYSV